MNTDRAPSFEPGQATLVPVAPNVPTPDTKAPKVKRPPKPEPKESIPNWCHEVTLENVRGSENYHVCTVRVDESPYMHADLHACPCGYVWGHPA